MAGKMVEFPSNGHTAKGYLATPASGKGPGVLVIQEWWGLVGHIKNVCDRFAAAGFSALAPDLYHGQTATEPDAASERQKPLRRRLNETSSKGPLGAGNTRRPGSWRALRDEQPSPTFAAPGSG